MRAKFFVYERGYKNFYLASFRPCRCTLQAGEHEWSEQCDRFPQAIYEMDGETITAEEFEGFVKLPSTRPLGDDGLSAKAEYQYQVDLKAYDKNADKPQLRDLPPQL